MYKNIVDEATFLAGYLKVVFCADKFTQMWEQI
jgi:hypothetical protein